MKLHYKKEHISCTNYKSESYEGFGIGTLTSGSNFNSQTLSVKTNFLIFILEGEVEIIPGVSVYESFGHCPGHMSIAVQTEDGPYFCVGDSVFVMGNIDAPQAMQDELHYDICPPGRFVDIVAAWETVRDHVRRCKEAGVDPHKHLLLAHDVILSAAVEKYEDSHDNKIPVIGTKDSDFVFDEFKTAIIDKDAKKAAAKAQTKYFS